MIAVSSIISSFLDGIVGKYLCQLITACAVLDNGFSQVTVSDGTVLLGVTVQVIEFENVIHFVVSY